MESGQMDPQQWYAWADKLARNVETIKTAAVIFIIFAVLSLLGMLLMVASASY